MSGRTEWNNLPFLPGAMEAYLSQQYQTAITIQEITPLSDGEEADSDKLKGFGYGRPLLLHIHHTDSGKTEKLVFHTMAGDEFGHNRLSDRARNILLDYHTFNKLSQHVPAVDVGVVSRDGQLASLQDAEEFFLMTRFVSGKLYAEDLKRIAVENALQPADESRLMTLVNYLVKIHQRKNPSPASYRRCIRDLLGLGEGIMGIIDSYPEKYDLAPPARLQAIEEKCVQWRWRLKNKNERLSQIHGDFHPWNVLFQEDDHIALLDRSRGEWGDPADDVCAMSINYILFALESNGRFQGSFQRLFERFWQQYIQQSGDTQILEVAAPFLAWRGLVLANLIWYPNLDPDIRAALFRFIENVLAADVFEPTAVNDYLELATEPVAS